jgi:alpha-tubulin suppressor-like RCC1 family protein
MGKHTSKMVVATFAILALVTSPVVAASGTPQNQAANEVWVNQIASGSNHACVIDSNEHVACWGDNEYGQTTVPTDLGEVSQVTVGGYSSCALKITGIVKCWGGFPSWKQIYLQDINEVKVPAINEPVIAISSDFWNSCAIGLSRDLYCWGGNQYGESPVGISGIEQVDVGFLTTCAVTSAATVQCWGNNDSGQTDVPSDLGPVKQVAAGVHPCAVTTLGEVKCWGRDWYGELSIPTNLGFVTQVSVGERNVCALNTQGVVTCWGDTESRINSLPVDISSVKEVSASTWIGCAISVSGKVWCWGDGLAQTQGVLPVPTFAPRDLPRSPSVSITGYTDSSVALNWAAPDNGGEPILDYVVEYYLFDGGSDWMIFNDGVSLATSTVVTGLKTGQPYLFRLAAVTAAGQGSYSSVLSEKPSTLPQVSALVSPSKTDSTVTLSWAGTANGDDIYDYVVEYSSNAGKTWTTFVDGVSSTASAVVQGLTRGTSYQFRVSAVNRYGQSGPASQATVIPSAPPGSPVLTVGAHSGSSVALNWAAPDNGGEPILDYVVEYNLFDGGSDWMIFNDGVSLATSTVVTGLKTGQPYLFRLAAVTAAGQGSYSSVLSEKPSTLPQVSALVSPSKTDSTVTLSWAGTANGDDIYDYVVEYSSNAGKTWTTFVDGVSSTASAVVQWLTRGTSYQFRVSAVNRDGQSGPTGLAPVVTNLSNQPKSLIASVKGSTKFGGKAIAHIKGGISGSKITYQWLLDGKKISGATQATYKILKSQIGRKLSFSATSKAKGFKDLVVVSASIKLTK